MEKIEKGDVVKLKSGGPLMTVQELEEDRRYFCIWFLDNKRETGSFHRETIRLVKKSVEAEK